MNLAKCGVEGCEKKVHSHGYCSPHSHRLRRYGNPLGGGSFKVEYPKVCQVEGCERKSKSNGYCNLHYQRLWKTGDPLGLKPGQWEGYVRPTCKVEGCEAIAHAKELCASHFFRQRRHGDPLAGRRPNVTGTPDERFLALREIDADGCWLCTTRPQVSGYGQFNPGGNEGGVYWHQWAYKRFVGPIPEGYDIDHVCHNHDLSCEGGVCKHRRCGNPEHLEAVPPTVNRARGRERQKMKLEKEFREWVFQ